MFVFERILSKESIFPASSNRGLERWWVEYNAVLSPKHRRRDLGLLGGFPLTEKVNAMSKIVLV